MQAKTETAHRTVTETARRAQIVQCTIETIADLGYTRASFAQIAKRAGLSSTGMISYHFAGKDELIGQTVAEIHQAIGGFMAARVGSQPTPTAMLQAYLQGNIEFLTGHRPMMKALLEIFLHFRPADGSASYDTDTEQTVLSHLEQILHAGQHSGEFRAFDTRVMAMTIQRAVDGLPFALDADPSLDLDLCARELSTLFDLATRADRP